MSGAGGVTVPAAKPAAPGSPAREVHHVSTFAALGTTAVLFVTKGDSGPEALRILTSWVSDVDAACSRFRADSEIMSLGRPQRGGPQAVSRLLFEALEVGLRAAELTGGIVDPTVGAAMQLIGYDRDFPLVPSDGPAVTFKAVSVPGWKAVRLDYGRRTVEVPPGVVIDLGATAKALCADRAARAIAEELETGVLVSLGGDISVAGPSPEAGWPIRIADDHAAPLDGDGPVVSILSGGLATSSTTVRAWRRGGVGMHHLIDPATSLPAQEYWRTVSVAAGSCVDANTASTACIVMGSRAADWLARSLLPGRLVRLDGSVETVGGWPPDCQAVSDPQAVAS